MGKGSKGKEKEAARQNQSREEKGRKTQQQQQQQQYDGAFLILNMRGSTFKIPRQLQKVSYYLSLHNFSLFIQYSIAK